MRVICRNIYGTSGINLGDDSPWLKLDKEYVVLALNCVEGIGLHIYIQTEHYNEPMFIDISGFEFINQSFPSSWVAVSQEAYDRKTMIFLPKSWDYDDFFEQVSDEQPDAVALFIKEAEQIYREEGLI